MEFDFTTILHRHGMDALAVDGLGHGFAPDAPAAGFDAIPMWVADMNFAVPPSITDEIFRRTSHPAFGYFSLSPEYYGAIRRWQASQNGVTALEDEDIGYENGVLGGVISAVSALAAPGDSVLVHSPTYIGFTHCLEESGFHIVHSPLYLDQDGVWRMDYEDMDRKLKAHHIRTAIFCSPHNPCGRVWTTEELEQAMEVYRINDCTVIADEIWSDLTLFGNQHTPVQSVSTDARSRTVALYAPSKTFNLAGLVGSYHIIYNPALRDRVRSRGRKSHYNNPNVLSMHALVGAYSDQGRRWLTELRQVLGENVRYGCDFIDSRLPGLRVSRPQGTYMLFVNCEEWCRSRGVSMDELEHALWSVGVAVQDGRAFHGPWALRMNLALPQSRVEEAFHRMEKYVFSR